MTTAASRVLVALSPGSRSTPLVLALAARPELEVVDVVDERGAAFFALGHARATGRLAVVVATSGTAPAHWYPAVIEASESGVPLLLLSADRPTELMNCGAPQTIDQTRLFGHHVRWFADLGDPSELGSWQRHVDRTLAVAIDRATGIEPGPVHLNVRARKPLERSTPADATDLMAERIAAAIASPALTIAARRVAPTPAALDTIAARIELARRPLMLVGPLPVGTDVTPIVRLADRLGSPIAAEWGSQLRREGTSILGALDLLIEAGRCEADLLIQIGGHPTPSAYERWTATPSGAALPRVVLGTLADAPGTAEIIALGEASEICGALAERVAPRARWDAALVRDHDRARAAITAELAESDPLGEGAAVKLAIDTLPAGATLILGNSLPIRTADRYAESAAALSVIVQRGVNGIDGLIAGACGSAHGTQAPTLAIIGDVSALHDVGSLALLARGPRGDGTGALTVLVIDNGGGRIFEGLPIGRRDDLAHAMPHFLTEHGVDLSAVGRAFGIATARVESRSALRDALASAHTSNRPALIVAVVPPHDARDREARIRTRLNARAT